MATLIRAHPLTAYGVLAYVLSIKANCVLDSHNTIRPRDLDDAITGEKRVALT